ncbi:hypothetical protein Gbfr_015_018 [Gluconobacter frateurii M-2]|nr:hypothetical protein Gbfr_015_018 [Gluconobacter frateurii M-2]
MLTRIAGELTDNPRTTEIRMRDFRDTEHFQDAIDQFESNTGSDISEFLDGFTLSNLVPWSCALDGFLGGFQTLFRFLTDCLHAPAVLVRDANGVTIGLRLGRFTNHALEGIFVIRER